VAAAPEGVTGTPEGVDLDALRVYFAAHVDGARDRPLTAELIAGGRSNLTYAIGDGEHEWVLRRPPLGHVLETAHDMGREFRVLSGLAGTDVPVPRVHALCEDPAVNGAPFYVMERVDGRILRNPTMMAELTLDEAQRCSYEVVDVLARLHAVDYGSVGLGDFGRPDGFLERNLRRWGKQWQSNKTRERPAIDELARRLEGAMPAHQDRTIVHGDYRIDNTMLAPDDPGRIVAVLDWEMSTLGDPLTDLGLLAVYWGDRNGAAVLTAQGVSDVPGFLSRDEVMNRYAEQSGRDLADLDFYVVYAGYKLAIIVEGIHARFLMGKTLGTGFDEMGSTVDALAETALDVANRSSIRALRRAG
jgi:aminoglycoside phosphotransferase (APT) family kinase protein